VILAAPFESIASATGDTHRPTYNAVGTKHAGVNIGNMHAAALAAAIACFLAQQFCSHAVQIQPEGDGMTMPSVLTRNNDALLEVS